jgi:hypothetical protein
MNMNRSLILVAAVAVSAAASAQTPPDVPANHWAAPAVTSLYELGILNGYPDGNFRGSRPATRYELAQALSKFFEAGKSITGDLQAQLDAIKATRSGQSDVEGLASLRKRMDGMDRDLAVLQRQRSETKELTSTFAALLAQLRALRENVNSMKLPDLPGEGR